MPTAVPQPGYPMLTRVVTGPPFPEKAQGAAPRRGRAEELVEWVVDRPHPLVPDMKVVRMFADPRGVEAYSLSTDGKSGMRDDLPVGRLRLIEEAIPLDLVVDELLVSEDRRGGEP